jgi:hypothetical protein
VHPRFIAALIRTVFAHPDHDRTRARLDDISPHLDADTGGTSQSDACDLTATSLSQLVEPIATAKLPLFARSWPSEWR